MAKAAEKKEPHEPQKVHPSTHSTAKAMEDEQAALKANASIVGLLATGAQSAGSQVAAPTTTCMVNLAPRARTRNTTRGTETGKGKGKCGKGKGMYGFEEYHGDGKWSGDGGWSQESWSGYRCSAYNLETPRCQQDSEEMCLSLEATEFLPLGTGQAQRKHVGAVPTINKDLTKENDYAGEWVVKVAAPRKSQKAAKLKDIVVCSCSPPDEAGSNMEVRSVLGEIDELGSECYWHPRRGCHSSTSQRAQDGAPTGLCPSPQPP